jgi:pyruvate/2-oxoglutarate dehydrogenase complex dihydrolipoamide acyltransferase (E2) component
MAGKYDSKFLETVKGEYCNKIKRTGLYHYLNPFNATGPTTLEVTSDTLTPNDKLFLNVFQIRMFYTMLESTIESVSTTELERVFYTLMMMNLLVDETKLPKSEETEKIKQMKQSLLKYFKELCDKDTGEKVSAEEFIRMTNEAIALFEAPKSEGGGKKHFKGQMGQQFRTAAPAKRAMEYKKPNMRVEKEKERSEVEEYLRKRRAALKEIRDTWACWAQSNGESFYTNHKEFESSLKSDPEGNVDLSDTLLRLVHYLKLPLKLGENIFLGLKSFYQGLKGKKAKYGKELLSLFFICIIISVTAGVATAGARDAPSYTHLLPGAAAAEHAARRGQLMGSWVDQQKAITTQLQEWERSGAYAEKFNRYSKDASIVGNSPNLKDKATINRIQDQIKADAWDVVKVQFPTPFFQQGGVNGVEMALAPVGTAVPPAPVVAVPPAPVVAVPPAPVATAAPPAATTVMSTLGGLPTQAIGNLVAMSSEGGAVITYQGIETLSTAVLYRGTELTGAGAVALVSLGAQGMAAEEDRSKGQSLVARFVSALSNIGSGPPQPNNAAAAAKNIDERSKALGVYNATFQPKVWQTQQSEYTQGLPIITGLASIATLLRPLQTSTAHTYTIPVANSEPKTISDAIRPKITEYLENGLKIKLPNGIRDGHIQSVADSVTYINAYYKDGAKTDAHGFVHEIGNVYIITEKTSAADSAALFFGLADQAGIGTNILGIRIVIVKRNVRLQERKETARQTAETEKGNLQTELGNAQDRNRVLEGQISEKDAELEDHGITPTTEAINATKSAAIDAVKAAAKVLSFLNIKIFPELNATKAVSPEVTALKNDRDALVEEQRKLVLRMKQLQIKINVQNNIIDDSLGNHYEFVGILQFNIEDFYNFKNIVVGFLKAGKDDATKLAIDTCVNLDDISILNAVEYAGLDRFQMPTDVQSNVYRGYARSQVAVKSEFFKGRVGQCVQRNAKAVSWVANNGMALLDNPNISVEAKANGLALVHSAQRATTALTTVAAGIKSGEQLTPILADALTHMAPDTVKKQLGDKWQNQLFAAAAAGVKEAGSILAATAAEAANAAKLIPKTVGILTYAALPAFGIGGLISVASYGWLFMPVLPMNVAMFGLGPLAYKLARPTADVSEDPFGWIVPSVLVCAYKLGAKILKKEEDIIYKLCKSFSIRGRVYPWMAKISQYNTLVRKQNRTNNDTSRLSTLKSLIINEFKAYKDEGEFRKYTQQNTECIIDYLNAVKHIICSSNNQDVRNSFDAIANTHDVDRCGAPAAGPRRPNNGAAPAANAAAPPPAAPAAAPAAAAPAAAANAARLAVAARAAAQQAEGEVYGQGTGVPQVRPGGLPQPARRGHPIRAAAPAAAAAAAAAAATPPAAANGNESNSNATPRIDGGRRRHITRRRRKIHRRKTQHRKRR